MRIAVGCDHRGLEVKQSAIRLLEGDGHICRDFGCFGTEAVDYPDIARAASEAVAIGEFDRGILICGTGIGMSIAANKVRSIRAALCTDVFRARRSRQHNDANVLCLGAEDNVDDIADIIRAFLITGFEGGRHAARLDKIREMEGEGRLV